MATSIHAVTKFQPLSNRNLLLFSINGIKYQLDFNFGNIVAHNLK